MVAGVQLHEYLQFAWDSLRANKIRSFLTTLGILIGVLTIIIIFTVIQSINNYVEGEFADIGSTTVYVSKFPWVIKGNYFELRNRPAIHLKEYEFLRDHARYARWISPSIESMRTVSYRDKSLMGVYTVGCNEQYNQTNNVSVDLGRWFTAIDVQRARPVAVIGAEIMDKLFDKTDPLGRRIKINGFPYKIIGVLKREGSFFGFSIDRQVLIPYTAFRGYAMHRRGITIAMKVEDASELEDMKAETRGLLRQVRKIPPGEKDNFSINQQDMLTDFYKQITGTSYLVIFIIGAISLVVGGIGIMNIMLVSVTERTKEIGIRKAIGATRNQILLQFLTESLAISSIGGIIGMILGVAAAEIPLRLMHLNTSVSVFTVLIGFGFSAFVGVVSGLYPAYKAAKMSPIDALSYE